MAKKSQRESPVCPVPEEFRKWWLRRANLHARHLREEGKPMRAGNYVVTEHEANLKFKLTRRNFAPGEVMRQLQACDIPVVDMTEGEYQLAWNPKAFDISKSPPLK
jgi:hypothetical protein